MSELRLNTDGHIIKFGADNDVSLTHVADTGLLLNSTRQLQFNDASQNINAPSATVLDINATDEIELNATLVDINANVEISGTATTTGVHTFSATPVFPDGSLALADLDIDGGTDIGAAIVDADLFIIDDGAGGTNRKTAASRIKTYVGGVTLSGSTNNNVATVTGANALLGEANLIFDGTNLGVGLTTPNSFSGYSTVTIGGAASTTGSGLDFENNSGTILARLFGDASGSQYGTASGLSHRFEVDGTEYAKIGVNSVLLASGTKLATGGETAPDVNAGGICIDQNATDGAILTFKSSDVAHGITAQEETDTFGKIRKNTGGDGGLFVAGYGEAAEGIFMAAIATTTNAAKSTSGIAPFEVNAQLKDGTGFASGGLGSNINLFCVSSATATKFIVDHEGDIHYDGSDAGAYDTYDDAQLVRAFDLSHGRGVINSKFDKFVSYNHEKLAEMKLVGREEDGTPNHFINTTGMQRLHNGAIWQQYEKHNQLLEAVYDLAKEAVGEEKANAILDKHEVKRLN